MLHLFADPSDMQGDTLAIHGPDVNHIRNVLRMKKGDEISVSNGVDDTEYRYGIEEITENAVFCRLRFTKDADVELPVRVTLFQGLPKGDKMEWIVQKCTELGVSEIVPVETARSVVKLDAAKKTKKTARWQTIAQSAAEQSRRRVVPSVHEPVSMEEAVRMAESADVRLIPYELSREDPGTKEVLDRIRPGDSVAVFIGPEGGFEKSEVALAEGAGITKVSLGRRILRTETAGMTVLSWLIYLLEIR